MLRKALNSFATKTYSERADCYLSRSPADVRSVRVLAGQLAMNESGVIAQGCYGTGPSSNSAMKPNALRLDG